jgi:multiple sugar transport system substrate-binding protein
VVEIEFSYIWDNAHDKRVWAMFMDEFYAQHGIKVHIREEMTWDNAWAELFSYTSIAKAPHVSHIGSSWINSLARLKILRPFKPDELAAMGGSWDFVLPNWESGILAEEKSVWAIPWTTWIYAICYRKDLLEQVGINPAEAFGTVDSIVQTIQKLVASPLEMPWLNSHIVVSNRDFLHIAASWIWAAGGDFTDKEGRTITFSNPQAIQGLKQWLDIYLAVQERHRTLTQPVIFDLFREGRAAAVLANIYGANTFIGGNSAPIVRENIGVASISDTPWTGGGSFVIWEHVRRNPQVEHAAVELVKFIASKEINIRYHNETYSMPSRIDALKEVYPDGNPAREAVMQTATKGRHYYNTPVWRRIVQLLSVALGTIVDEAMRNPGIDTEAILHKHLDKLAHRLNSIMPT